MLLSRILWYKKNLKKQYIANNFNIIDLKIYKQTFNLSEKLQNNRIM